MPVFKRVLCKERLRKVPQQFSWIDHRLVRDGHAARCSTNALALYLFLVTVGDAQGLSYYADKTLCRLLRLDAGMLGSARAELIANRLIAYQCPLYQVLALDPPRKPPSAQSSSAQSSSRPTPSPRLDDPRSAGPVPSSVQGPVPSSVQGPVPRDVGASNTQGPQSIADILRQLMEPPPSTSPRRDKP
jgi:hypothetical protein